MQVLQKSRLHNRCQSALGQRIQALYIALAGSLCSVKVCTVAVDSERTCCTLRSVQGCQESQERSQQFC